MYLGSALSRRSGVWPCPYLQAGKLRLRSRTTRVQFASAT